MSEFAQKHPHRGRLPAGAIALLRYERRKFLWVLAGLFVVTFGLGIGLAVGAKEKNAVWASVALSAIIFLCGVPLPFAIWIHVRRLAKQLTQFASGEYVAHWTYSPEEWSKLDANWKPGDPLGEAYIGTAACFWGDTFFEWNRFGCVLEKVELVDGPPPAILLLCNMIGPESNSVLRSFQIPVAAGHDAEARHVLRTLEQSCGKRNGCLMTCLAVFFWLVAILGLVISILSFFVK